MIRHVVTLPQQYKILLTNTTGAQVVLSDKLAPLLASLLSLTLPALVGEATRFFSMFTEQSRGDNLDQILEKKAGDDETERCIKRVFWYAISGRKVLCSYSRNLLSSCGKKEWQEF